jgi:hypothetical protein
MRAKYSLEIEKIQVAGDGMILFFMKKVFLLKCCRISQGREVA